MSTPTTSDNLQPDASPPSTSAPQPGTSRRGNRPLLIGSAVVVVLVAAAALIFTVGPLSPTARTERKVAKAVQQIGDAASFTAFNDKLCQSDRMPQEMIDTIAKSGKQTGTDFDAMFRDQAMAKFPSELSVEKVTLDSNKDSASVAVKFSSDGQEQSDNISMRLEEGVWRICGEGIGMGAVPQNSGGN